MQMAPGPESEELLRQLRSASAKGNFLVAGQVLAGLRRELRASGRPEPESCIVLARGLRFYAEACFAQGLTVAGQAALEELRLLRRQAPESSSIPVAICRALVAAYRSGRHELADVALAELQAELEEILDFALFDRQGREALLDAFGQMRALQALSAWQEGALGFTEILDGVQDKCRRWQSLCGNGHLSFAAFLGNLAELMVDEGAGYPDLLSIVHRLRRIERMKGASLETARRHASLMLSGLMHMLVRAAVWRGGLEEWNLALARHRRCFGRARYVGKAALPLARSFTVVLEGHARQERWGETRELLQELRGILSVPDCDSCELRLQIASGIGILRNECRERDRREDADELDRELGSLLRTCEPTAEDEEEELEWHRLESLAFNARRLIEFQDWERAWYRRAQFEEWFRKRARRRGGPQYFSFWAEYLYATGDIENQWTVLLRELDDATDVTAPCRGRILALWMESRGDLPSPDAESQHS